MKILTWNINGIRATNRCLKDVLDSLDADVICLQETKITRDMLDEPSAIVEGYNAYFSFSRKRSGYSGTANFCRDAVTPCGAEEGLSGQLVSLSEGSIGCQGNVGEFEADELLSLDGEGRAVITQHQIQLRDGDAVSTRDLAIINVYVPRAAEQDERWAYKLRFLALLQSRAESLLRAGRHVIILGDINTTHKRIDHCDPTTQEFLRPHSRQWIDQLLRAEDRDPELPPIDDRPSFEATLSDAEGGRFLDAFRFFRPDQTEAYTNWCTLTAARQTNYGKRLDYIFADSGLEDFLVDCRIVADFEGSDHCPVVLELRCDPCPAPRCPPICTRLMPEFQGRQQKLSAFFSRTGVCKGKQPPQGGGGGGTDRERDVKVISSEGQVKAGVENQAEVDGEGQVKVSSQGRVGGHGRTFEETSWGAGGGEAVCSQSSTLSISPPSSSPVLPTLATADDASCIKSSQPGSLKRTLTGKVADVDSSRKKKKGGKGVGSNTTAKQASLLNFFQKPPSSSGSGLSAKCGDSFSHKAVSKYWQKSDTQSPSKLKPSPSKLSSSAVTGTERSSSKLSLPSLTLIADALETTQPQNSASQQGNLSEKETYLSSEEKNNHHRENSPTENTQIQHSKSSEEQHLPSPQRPQKEKASALWKGLLPGPPPPPPCRGHKEPCVLHTVKKAGPTRGKQFFVCARAEGLSTNKEARCKHFQWVNYSTKKS